MYSSESQLTVKLREGSKQAFTHLFYMYKDKLYGFLSAFVGNEEQSYDLTQDIFLKLWQNREHLPEIENLDAYIFSMAKNIALDGFRRIAKEALVLENLSMEHKYENPTPEDDLMEKELVGKINEAIRQLPPQQQKIFILYKQEGLKHEEIAQQLNVSVSTSKNALRNAIENIRKILTKSYPDMIFLFILFFDC
jgi:RNA polymerase sigma-70 factor (ECF subfamily)